MFGVRKEALYTNGVLEVLDSRTFGLILWLKHPLNPKNFVLLFVETFGFVRIPLFLRMYLMIPNKKWLLPNTNWFPFSNLFYMLELRHTSRPPRLELDPRYARNRRIIKLKSTRMQL